MSWLAVVIVGGTAAGGPLAGLIAAQAGRRAPFVVGAAASVAAVLVVSLVPGSDVDRPVAAGATGRR
jgi:hypothetical protein